MQLFSVLVLLKKRFSFPPLPGVKFLRLYTASTSPREVGGLLHLFQNLEAIHINWTIGDLWTSFYDYTLPSRDLEDGYRYDYLDAEVFLILLEFKNLWKEHKLQFHILQDKESTAASDFINHALLLWNETRIVEFNIIFEKFNGKSKCKLDTWLKFARLEELMDLHIELSVNHRISIAENRIYPPHSLLHDYRNLNIVVLG